jgi:hypothetical protein
MKRLWFGCFVLCAASFALPALAADDDETKVYRVDEVIEAFESNAAAVDENYLHKRLQVNGMVRRVTRAEPKAKDDAVEYIVELGIGPYYGPDAGFAPAPSAYGPPGTGYPGQPRESKLEFRCTAKERKNLAGLRRGALVTLEGKCEQQGEKKTVGFEEARLIKVHEARPVSPTPVPGGEGPTVPMSVPGFAPAFPTTPPMRAIPVPDLPAPRPR